MKNKIITIIIICIMLFVSSCVDGNGSTQTPTPNIIQQVETMVASVTPFATAPTP